MYRHRERRIQKIHKRFVADGENYSITETGILYNTRNQYIL